MLRQLLASKFPRQFLYEKETETFLERQQIPEAIFFLSSLFVQPSSPLFFLTMISLRPPSWNISTILCVLVLLIPTISGDCTCDATSKDPKSNTALHYKVGAIAAILVSSVLGVSFPVLGRTIPALKPENDFFFIIKAFAAGVILATGFIHILPDAFENLSSPCLSKVPWGNYPFTGFFAMLSAILTLMVDGYASSYYRKSHQNKQANKGEERGDEQAGHIPVHTHATHGHAHGSVSPAHGDLALPDLIRHRVIAQVLELGIVFHSVIIGVDLGVSQSVGDIKSLLIALCFHQFFEGIGLGGCITQAKFKSMSAAIMAAFFSLTTPVGVAIGIGISSTYNENSSTALIVEGTLNALAAGILIYMSLVDLLAQDFMNPRLQANMKLQLGANGSMLLGAGCMALLAYWA